MQNCVQTRECSLPPILLLRIRLRKLPLSEDIFRGLGRSGKVYLFRQWLFSEFWAFRVRSLVKKGLASGFAGSFFFSQPVRKPIPFLTVIPVRLLLLYHSRFFISIDESDDIFPFVLCRMNKNGRKWGEKEDAEVADMRAVGRQGDGARTEGGWERGRVGRRGRRPLQGKKRKSIRRRKVGGKEGALLIHRGAVPLLQQEKAKVR